MRRVFAICAVLACFAGISTPQSAPDPLDNLTPTQHILFENEWVKMIEDIIPPGGVEPMHRHKKGVVFYLVDYQTDDTTPDGKLVHQTRKGGTAVWSNPVTHSVKNVGTVTSHAMRLELKRDTPPPPPVPDPMDSVAKAGQTQTVIFENEYVRAINDIIPPNVTEPTHHHAHGVVVYLSPNYVSEQIRPDGTKTMNSRKQYEAQWAEALTHSVRNPGTAPTHAIRIELKY